MGVRGDLTRSMLKDMYACRFEVWDQEKPLHPVIFSVVDNCTGAGEVETQLLGAEQLIEATSENAATEFSEPIEGWTYYCKYRTFKRGLRLSAEQVEDNIKIANVLKTYAKTWAKREIQIKETYAAYVFNYGGNLSGHDIFSGTHVGNTDPSGNLMYDSKPFFALAGNEYTHKGGAKYYNSIAGLSLTPQNFETIYNLISVTNAYEEDDSVMSFKPDTLLTQCGADEFVAKRICESELLPFSQNNDINVYRGLVTPLAWRYLTDTGAFYVGKRGSELLQFRNRLSARIRYFEDEHDDSHNATYRVRFGIWVKGRPWARGGGSSAA